MADEGTQEATTETAPPEEGAALGDAGKRALDAERRAKRTAEKQVADLTTQLQQLTDAQKGDAERALDQARREAAEQASAPLAKELARYKVALSKGLSADDLEFLTGDTEEEMSARADKLLERFGQTAKAATPSFNGGARTQPASEAADFNAMIRRAAGRG